MKLTDNRLMGVDWGEKHSLSAIVVADMLAGGIIRVVHSETFEAPTRMEFDAHVACVSDIFGHDDQVDACAYAFNAMTSERRERLAARLARKLESLKSKRRAQRLLDRRSRVRATKRHMELVRRSRSRPRIPVH